ncbi:hypothetical protein P691DRAFT_812435 [Macrolepiota fuliginosa MF-IS2]|uniref:TECPR1-like DysF domain-containing protein n=1 Tax=Macrolepiota fuliginosa MF-IS2 TaxID=1400762 RepID=A0A9P6C9B8_9AGAR|nr:hypothetical protein P691DRAFT_812435 [Macrolepiota fuliginosa MF-IS2]
MVSPTSQITAPLSPEQLPPPPPTQDDPHAADAVRQRLVPTSRLSRIFSSSRLRLRSSSKRGPQNDVDSNSEIHSEISEIQETSASNTASATDYIPIVLDNNGIQGQDDETKDKFEWAIVYENQRGMTLFSISYYSALSLLPTDPSAFTLPNASQKRSQQPPITLSTYPLPDGNWRWVSRAWMIDMRSDPGIVQHDGFEYNWMFRRHKWHPEVGFLSAGGWVRRRRWVRLMMRPGKTKSHHNLEGSPPSSSPSSSINLLRNSITSSNLTSTSDLLHTTIANVWQGNEGDWRRCRSLTLRYVQDGRKIELWRTWLGYYHPAHQARFKDPDHSRQGKTQQKQWTEDDGPLLSQLLDPDAASHRSMTPPPREYIAPVLRKHGRDLLQLFIYPDSRVQFLKLLGKAGLLPDLGATLDSDFSMSEVEFWSYTNGLSEEFKHLDIKNTPSVSGSASYSFSEVS